MPFLFNFFFKCTNINSFTLSCCSSAPLFYGYCYLIVKYFFTKLSNLLLLKNFPKNQWKKLANKTENNKWNTTEFEIFFCVHNFFSRFNIWFTKHIKSPGKLFFLFCFTIGKLPFLCIWNEREKNGKILLLFYCFFVW